MNVLGGGGRKKLVVDFVTNTAKAVRDVEKLTKSIQHFGEVSKVASSGGKGKSASGAASLFDWISSPALKNATNTNIPYFSQGILGQSVPFTFLKSNAALDGAMKEISEGMRITGGLVTASLTKFSVAIAIAIAAVAAFGFVIHKTVEQGKFLERSITQLEVLYHGDKNKARDTMKKVNRYALLTPFTPTDVMGAAVVSSEWKVDMFKKGAYGLKPDQDAAKIFAGVGSFTDTDGNDIGMTRAAQALLRGDYRMLKNVRGVVDPAWQKAKTVGQVGTAKFNEKFIEELGKVPEIMNMAEARSRTVAGLWSDIAGFSEKFRQDFSGAGEADGIITFWSQLREMLKDIKDAGLWVSDNIAPMLTNFGASLMGIFKVVWDLIVGIWKSIQPLILPALRLISSWLHLIFEVVKGILSTVGKFLKFVGEAVGGLVQIISHFTGVFSLVEVILKAIADTATFTQLLFFDWGIWFDAMILKIKSLVTEAGKWIDAFFDKLNNATDKFLESHPMLKEIFDAIVENPMASGALVGLLSGILTMNPVVGVTAGGATAGGLKAAGNSLDDTRERRTGSRPLTPAEKTSVEKGQKSIININKTIFNQFNWAQPHDINKAIQGVSGN